MSIKVGAITVARSDYGIYRPVLRALQNDGRFNLRVYVSGSHLSERFGFTVREVEADGFPIAARIEMLEEASTPEAISKSIGRGVLGFAQEFARETPDIILILGDRFEMFAGAIATMPFTIPLVHLHGGEVTEGAIDEAIRHSLTKMSHLHFTSTDLYAQRLLRMGEEPWRVTVSGAPSLDNISRMSLYSRPDFQETFQIKLSERFILATFHPVTLQFEDTAAQIGEFLQALDSAKLPVLFTGVNADTNSDVVAREIARFVAEHPGSALVEHLGTRGYFSAMKYAAAMAGNSSSGILEAASFKLPVVNVGVRQQGRVRAANIIDVPAETPAISAGLAKALSPEFRASLADLVNPYGDGHAAARIVEKLAALPDRKTLLLKKFQDA